MDKFFSSLPKDTRFHIEFRTESYLNDLVFEVLEKHRVGLVLSHRTWLPPLRVQFAKSGKRFFKAGRECVIRLMTPLGMKYEEAYSLAHPFSEWLIESSRIRWWKRQQVKLGGYFGKVEGRILRGCCPNQPLALRQAQGERRDVETIWLFRSC